jgi:hypothetical protein
MPVHLLTRAHQRTYSNEHMHAFASMLTQMHTYTHAHTHAQARTHNNAQSDVHVHTCTRTHILALGRYFDCQYI